jgi:hypothetical protein
MKKSHLILFIGGVLIAAGMVASYYGSKLVTQDLAITEGVVSAESSLEITKELDPEITSIGVFVVRVENFEAGLVATVLDPLGQHIVSKEISQESTEEEFEIVTKGDHRLLLENTGSADIPVIIGLTHMPDKNSIALNLLGQSIIISGFVGVGIAVIYEIKNRKKKIS